MTFVGPDIEQALHIEMATILSSPKRRDELTRRRPDALANAITSRLQQQLRIDATRKAPADTCARIDIQNASQVYKAFWQSHIRGYQQPEPRLGALTCNPLTRLG
jgi:hypothetical protein